MTRTGIIVSIISMVIMIILTIKWTLEMSIIITLSIVGIIIFATLESSDNEEVGN